MRKLLLILVLVGGCGGTNPIKPALDISRAACGVIEPICRVATTACAFVPDAPTSGGEAPP